MSSLNGLAQGHAPETALLKDAASRGMRHIRWDGCMFSNEIPESPETWNHVLAAMIAVDQAL